MAPFQSKALPQRYENRCGRDRIGSLDARTIGDGRDDGAHIFVMIGKQFDIACSLIWVLLGNALVYLGSDLASGRLAGREHCRPKCPTLYRNVGAGGIHVISLSC